MLESYFARTKRQHGAARHDYEISFGDTCGQALLVDIVHINTETERIETVGLPKTHIFLRSKCKGKHENIVLELADPFRISVAVPFSRYYGESQRQVEKIVADAWRVYSNSS